MKWWTIIVALAVILVMTSCSKGPYSQEPEITHGEFPFRLEYEIDGEIVVVEDTIICDFDGFGWDAGSGKHRKWKERLASGNEGVILLKVDDTKEIYLGIGSARYYMGDLFESEVINNNSIRVSLREYPNEMGGTSSNSLNEDELFEKYSIKLISWEPSPPITNSF